MDFIKKIFTSVLLLFGIGNKQHKVVPVPNSSPEKKGTDGEISANAAIVVKKERIVLVIDKDFEDVPSWVEWDIGLNRLSVAQLGGANASLRSLIPVNEFERFKQLDRILLIARYNGRRIVHYLSFLSRE